MTAPPTLETERLILREVTLADAPAIQRHFGTWAVIQHLSTGVPWPYPDDGALTFLTERLLPALDKGECLYWGITLKGGADEVIGGIEYREEERPEGNRGFWLGEPYWGRGYMTEAVVAVQDHLFFELGVERMVVVNSADNPASRRVKEKTGARFLDTVQIMHHHGGDATSERWEVTREAWAKLRGRQA